MLLVEIEGVFRAFKNDLQVRLIYHRVETRVEAHIFVSFLAYCLWVTLKQRLQALAPGLTPRQALNALSGVQMLDVVNAHDLRPATDPEPAHATRAERAIAVATTQTGVAGATAAAPGRGWKTGNARGRI